jgi:hypothetical protein
MPIINIIVFYMTGISIILLAISVYRYIHNKKAAEAGKKFLRQANDLNPTIFENIKLIYWSKFHLKTRTSPNCYCNLYLFDDYLVVIPRQDSIFKFIYAPVLITSDVANAKMTFGYLETFKLKNIIFNQFTKGEVDIKLPDPTHNISMTLKNLTESQISQLDKIKNWTKK